MLFERCQTVGVPTDVKRCAERVVAFGNFADVGHAPPAAFAPRGGLFLRSRFQGVKSGLNFRQQAGGKLNADHDGDKEIGKQERQERSGDFHDTARAAPARALSVVKNWTAFFHECLEQSIRKSMHQWMPPGSMAQNWAVGEPRPSARFRPLYCKMRCAYEANFLACRRRIDSRSLPAAVLRLQVSFRSYRHGALRAIGSELAAASRLCHNRGRGAGAGRFTYAGLPRILGCHLRDYEAHRSGRAAVCHAGPSGGGLVCLPAYGGSGGFAGVAQAEYGKLAARLYCDAVDCGAVPVHGELCGGSDDRSICDIFHGGCSCNVDRLDLEGVWRRGCALQERLGNTAFRSYLCTRERISDWDGDALSSRNAAPSYCGVDFVRFCLAAKTAVSFFCATRGALRDGLRFAAGVLGRAESRDATRSAVSRSQKFEYVRRIRSARIHGLGKNLALSHEGLLSRPVEARRRSDQSG